MFEHDPAGNLTFDGIYRYEYDAWNRLIRVTIDASGAERYSALYDALGRVVAVDRQPTAPPAGGIGPGTGPEYDFWREQYHYDGSRRVQDVVTYAITAHGSITQYQITEREYLWGPSYVDELLAVLDDERNVSTPRAS